MNELTLPPSPNWYMTSIMSCSTDNTVAWGSKNMLIISQPPKANSKSLDYSIITDAHTDRVTSVSFCPDYSPKKRLLLSGGDESIIRIWDLETLSAVHSQFYVDSKQKVAGVDWSPNNPSQVCSVSTDGTILSWNIGFNACQFITLGKMTATCIKYCPHKSNSVAVGAKAGLVYIVNLQGSGTITYKLRGHDTEITSLSWCPLSVNIFTENNPEDFLLASGAKDKSIFIWRAGGDGRYEFQLTLPSAPQDSNQHRSKLSSGYFTALCWLEPNLLLANSPFGELLAVDLNSTKKSWRLIHGHHSRGLFSITSVPIIVKNLQENWRTPSSPRIVWTSAQDRQVISTSLENNQCILQQSVPTQGGFIYCLSACPLETSLIAYGSGDMAVRLWNLTEPHDNLITVTCMWQKVMGRVTALAWHPTEENLLAFGTAEGRVGMFDTNNPNKLPTIFRQYHRRTVYSLSWAPKPGSDKYGLYSCADNELVYFNPEKVSEEPKSVVKKNCTEFAWKADLSCLAIGYEDGSISFRDSKELKPCGKTIFLLKKAVQCIAWHPDSTLTDLEFSAMRNYMAVSTSTNKITIFDMTIMVNNILNSSNDSEDKDMVTYKVMGTLNGHSDRVISLAWNPHISGQLVSGSYDSTAQVWNVETQEIIATFTGHRGPVYSCLWSSVDPDFIITGSVDFSLRVWKVSSQEIVFPVVTEVKKSKSKSKKLKTNKIVIEKKVNDIVNIGNGSEENLVLEIEKLSVKSETKVRDKKTKKTFLPVYRKMMNNKDIALENCLKIAEKLKNSEDKSCDINDEILSVFGTEEEIMSIIKNELTTFTSQGQHTMATELSLWTGDLKEQLQTAVKERRLNDFMVSLSPMVSINTWKEMCEAYATQLQLESNVTKAVAYFLIIHKIYRAIEVFMEAKMYREAYILARCKLDAKDKKVKEVLEAWEGQAAKSGVYEDAAQCSIALGDLVRAAQFLAKRKDVLNLKTAAKIALLAEDSALAKSLADQAVVECLLKSNYSLARDLIKEFPAVEYRLVHLVALEEINKGLSMIDDAFVRLWIKGETQYDLISVLNKSNDNFNCLEAYDKLVNITYPDFLQDDPNFWLAASHNFALAAAIGSEEHQLHHIVKTFGMISQYEILKSKNELGVSYLLRLLALLPLNIGFNNDGDNDKPIYKSYRAYLCFALTTWVLERINSDEFNVEKIICVIKKCLEDALDKDVVKFWTVTAEITKLEKLLTAAIGRKDEAEEAQLVERLNNIRSERKNFVEERECVPNPVVFYSKVNQLASLLEDSEFKDTVGTLWSKAMA
ncbi:GSCOCG00008959001-RA-CDS [Cotesia congregata]|nr:GSCOCG00008959001-RA-CDS [Cotesia congregata]